MKKFNRKNILTSLLTLTAMAAGVAAFALEYRAESGFQPFDTDRELQNKQVLFPDGESGNQVGENGADAESFWEKDENEQGEAGGGSGSGYLLSPGDQMVLGESSKTILEDAKKKDQVVDGLLPGDIYELADGTDGMDLILPGGNNSSGGGDGQNGGSLIQSPESGQDSADHTNGGQTPEKPGENPGTNTGDNTGGNTGGSTGGNTGSEDEKPGPGANLTKDPIPGNGSESRDEVSTDPMPPSDVDEDNSSDFDQALIDRLKAHEHEVVFAQPVKINRIGAEGLYKGQKNVDQLTLFQSIDSYVWDEQDQKAYYWTADDLDLGVKDGHSKHVRITGVAFDSYDESRAERITHFPVEIPEDADEILIYISYRLDVKDPWTEYESEKEDWGGVSLTPGVAYALQNARILVLNQIVESKGETIKRDNILNLDRQYVTEDNKEEGLNLLEYQGALLGADNTGKMSGLFPGWKEDGAFVPFSYPTEELVGRHVLEPAALVPFDREKYQVNIRSHYMNKNYEVGWSQGAKYISLQALTDYTGSDKLPMTETEYDRIDTLEVPQYVQAVEFDYIDGFSVNYLKLPDSVLYVNTKGIPSVEESGVLEERGLQVKKGYEVAEGNPRYKSENGLLYNKAGTEILGVPTGWEELDVDAGIEKVVLPYQNHMKYLCLHITDTKKLPEINYERLNADQCKIVVPDSLLSAYLKAEQSMLRETGLKVVAESNPDADCTMQDGFLLRHGSEVQEILRSRCTWLTLPKYVTGVDASALQKFQKRTDYQKPLEVIVLPASGKAVIFGEGSFNGYSKMTIGCYSDEQQEAAEALRAEYPECTFTIERVTVRGDGYRYLKAAGEVILCGVPDGIPEFYGSIPGVDGAADIPVTVIGDWAFAENRNGYNLQWLILPEGVRGVGYEAFKDCWSLEGAVLEGTPENGKKEFIIGEKAFDNCLWLRFLACNADRICQYDQGMALPDEEQDDPYGFLFCKKDAEVNDYTWNSFDDVDHYVMEDCGGTRVLYGATADGTLFRALRSGVRTREAVTLPATTREIYRSAFRGFYNPDWAAISINWEKLPELRLLGKYSFADSCVGEDLVLPDNVEIQTEAFSNCMWLHSIRVPGARSASGDGGICLGRAAFSGSGALQSVYLGELREGERLYPDLFSGTALTLLTFEDADAPELAGNSMGRPFYFMESQEKEGALHIAVPEGSRETYIQKWRFVLAGYEDYEDLQRQTFWNLQDELLRDPTEEEVQQETDSRLLAMENRIRRLLGMEEAEDTGNQSADMAEPEQAVEEAIPKEQETAPTEDVTEEPETDTDTAESSVDSIEAESAREEETEP